MEITGKLTKVNVMKTGTSAKGYWQKQSFILEQLGKYPRKACITTMGDNCDLVPTEIGKTYTVSVNVDSKEFKDNWYTELAMYKIQEEGKEAVSKKSQASTSTNQDDSSSEEDDLPF